MEKKMFGQESRFGSPKQRALKMFRLIRSLGNGRLNTSTSTDADDDSRQPNVVDVRGYLTSKQRMHEVETERAMILKELRHQNWKAGGPV